MLSLKSVLPRMPMIAALSANHLAALEFTAGLARLYVAQTETRRAARHPNDSAPVGKPPGSRFATWCRFGGISTRIYAGQDLKHYSPGS